MCRPSRARRSSVSPSPCPVAQTPTPASSSIRSTFGSSQSPASSPLDGRLRTAMRSPQRSRNTVRCSALLPRFGSFTGSFSAVPALRARQSACSGHSAQCGAPFGTHTVAPSSMRLCVKSPQWPAGYTSESAASSSFLYAGVSDGRSSFIRRAQTRSTFPSTAAAGSSKQIEAIAPAVYSPMPGRRISSDFVRGKAPPRATISFAHFCRLRARL